MVFDNQMLNQLQELSKLCETRPASMSQVLVSVRSIENELNSTVHNELTAAGIIEDQSRATIVSSNMPMEMSPTRKRWRANYES